MIQRFLNFFAIQFAQKNENLSRVSAEIFAAGKKKKQSPKKNLREVCGKNYPQTNYADSHIGLIIWI